MKPFENTAYQAVQYNCGDGAQQLQYRNVSLQARDGYVAVLKGEGYVTTATNRIGSCLFETLYRGEEGVHIGYYPAKSLLQIVTVTKGYTGSPAGAAVVTPSLLQPGRRGADLSSPNGAPGMSYVLQLSDGRYIIIDGGPDNAEDQAALLSYLKANNPDKTPGAKPVIAAWIFSHAHGDHMQLACSFLNEHHDEVEIQATVANFPNFELLTLKHENIAYMAVYANRWMELFGQYYPTAAVHKFHTGEQLVIGDAVIDVLFTHENFAPMEFMYGNDTSAAFNVTLGGKKICFLGDCDTLSNRYMADVYGNAVKCDILQLAHHGFNGGSKTLYQFCDPDICLWAVEADRFQTDKRCLGTAAGYEFNLWIRDNTVKARTHYHNSADAKLILA